MGNGVETIDQVVARLTEIVEEAGAEASRLGYFPALYRRVTIRVKEGIAEGFFDDGPRMERLDVIFARRYLDAFDAHRHGQPPTHAWRFAFAAAGEWWPVVLQHLLLGINAHINLDLGIAAARTVPPEQLPDLKADFDRINQILAALVGTVQAELAEVWTPLRLLDRLLGGIDESVVNFSLDQARAHAWQVAQRLAPLGEAEQAAEIARLDQQVVELARLIRYPGFVGQVVTKLVRLCERGTVPQIIEILT